jgi:hypothetical protein
MTKEELAAKLNGRQIGEELTEAESIAIKSEGLIVVFGASDDLMEFRGAIYDEADAYDGGTALIDQQGLLPDRDSIDEDEELEQFFVRRRVASKVEALWRKEPGYCWTFKTNIPHTTFDIMEDGKPWCRGIVFALVELK